MTKRERELLTALEDLVEACIYEEDDQWVVQPPRSEAVRRAVEALK